MLCEIKYLKPEKNSHYIKTFTKDEITSFTKYKTCPACNSGKDITTIIEIGGKDWENYLSLSICKNCLHIFYLNPPTKEFMDKFYQSKWLDIKESNASEFPYTEADDKFHNLIKTLEINNTNKVIDIGCGRGQLLKWFKENSFVNVFGCEMSENRFNFSKKIESNTFLGGYEAVPKKLEFDLIISNHVLEHIYTPLDFLEWANSRLTSSGYIVLTVPNPRKESSVYKTLFMPHLHSFSPLSLSVLGAEYDLYHKFFTQKDRPNDLTIIFSREETLLNKNNLISLEDMPNQEYSTLVKSIKDPWEIKTHIFQWSNMKKNKQGFYEINKLKFFYLRTKYLFESFLRHIKTKSIKKYTTYLANIIANTEKNKGNGLINFSLSNNNKKAIRICFKDSGVQFFK